MNALMLLLIVMGVTSQQVVLKAFNNRFKGGVYTFSAATALFAGIVFILTAGGKLHFSSDFLIYSLGFSLAYCVGTVGTRLAINTGSLSLTSLIISYSLIIPTFYGMIALKENITAELIIGIILLMVSLVLINMEGKVQKKGITVKWGIYALLGFLGNGFCSTVQKIQQINCDGLYKSEFMIVALIITVVVLLLIAFFTERKEIVPAAKKGLPFFAICGLANGAVNFLVIVLSSRMPVSVMFPIISAGGIIATAFISVFIYKEKMSVQQKLGLFLGTLAVIALNL